MSSLKINLVRNTLTALMLSGISHFVLADTQLNIRGVVQASPCAVTGGSDSEIDVELGNIQAVTLAAPSSFSAWVPFDLKLEDCPISTTLVTATFNGAPAREDATLYANSGDATNVQIELASLTDSTRLGNGQQLTQAVANTTSTYKLKARAYSSAGGATSGTIVGSVLVTFTYQ